MLNSAHFEAIPEVTVYEPAIERTPLQNIAQLVRGRSVGRECRRTVSGFRNGVVQTRLVRKEHQQFARDALTKIRWRFRVLANLGGW